MDLLLLGSFLLVVAPVDEFEFIPSLKRILTSIFTEALRRLQRKKQWSITCFLTVIRYSNFSRKFTYGYKVVN